MDQNPDVVISAAEFADEPLEVRFRLRNITLALLVEHFAFPRFLGLISKRYRPTNPVPTINEDRQQFEARLRQRFAPRLVDPIFAAGAPSPRGFESFDHYTTWVEENHPSDVSVENYSKFVIACDLAWFRWMGRWNREMKMLWGARLLARYGVMFGYFLILTSLGAMLAAGYTTMVLTEGVLVAVTMMACIAAKLISMKEH